MRKSTIDFSNRIDVANRHSAYSHYLSAVELRFDGSHDLLRYLVLQIENIFQRAVKSIRPQMGTGGGVDELSGNTQTTSRLTYAAFEDIAHAEFSSYLLDVDGLAFVSERRVTGDNEERLEPRKRRDDVLNYPICEKLLLRVAAQVLKRQYRD